MKLIYFIIFLAVFLTLFGLVNYYIYIRGLELLPGKSPVSYIYTFIFIVLSLSFLVGRIFEKASICGFSSVLIWTGSVWMAFMLYLFLPILLIDIVRLGDRFLNFLPDFSLSVLLVKRIIGSFVVVAASAVVFFGYINSGHPRIRTLDVDLDAKQSPMKSLNIVMVSDIHLGIIISNSRLLKMVETINGLEPDIVLFAGDVIDEDIAPVIENNLGDTLRNIKSKYGVYAVTGNHEYIGGVEPSVKYLSDHGITVLRDEWKIIGNAFYLVGREDRSMQNFNGKQRKHIGSLLEGIRHDLPIIMMDHQPFGLEEAVDNGIDLQLSGHTHHGQMWPINFITGRIYRISTGFEKIGNTRFYVSSGFGTWGPPVRTGSRSEIVNIRLTFAR